MKQAIVFIALLAISLSASAQMSSWKITLNKKAVIKSSTVDDTVANVIRVKKADLSNNNLFKIEFDGNKANEVPKGWVRSIGLFDEKGEGTAQKDSADQIFLFNKDLLKIIWTRKKLNICAWLAPADPAMAKAIRIKRNVLGVLILED